VNTFIGTLLTLQGTYNYHRNSLTVFFFFHETHLSLLMVKVTVMSALVVFRLHS